MCFYLLPFGERLQLACPSQSCYGFGQCSLRKPQSFCLRLVFTMLFFFHSENFSFSIIAFFLISFFFNNSLHFLFPSLNSCFIRASLPSLFSIFPALPPSLTLRFLFCQLTLTLNIYLLQSFRHVLLNSLNLRFIVDHRSY